jgi:hypothetical protein
MMIIEGKRWEERYEATGTLPVASEYTTEDEIEFYRFLAEIIPEDPKRWRRVISELSGVSYLGYFAAPFFKKRSLSPPLLY